MDTPPSSVILDYPRQGHAFPPFSTNSITKEANAARQFLRRHHWTQEEAMHYFQKQPELTRREFLKLAGSSILVSLLEAERFPSNPAEQYEYAEKMLREAYQEVLRGEMVLAQANAAYLKYLFRDDDSLDGFMVRLRCAEVLRDVGVDPYKYAVEAAKGWASIGEYFNLANSFLSLARIYEEQGDYRRAVRFSIAAEHIVRGLCKKRDVLEVLATLHQAVRMKTTVFVAYLRDPWAVSKEMGDLAVLGNELQRIPRVGHETQREQVEYLLSDKTRLQDQATRRRAQDILGKVWADFPHLPVKAAATEMRLLCTTIQFVLKTGCNWDGQSLSDLLERWTTLWPRQPNRYQLQRLEHVLGERRETFPRPQLTVPKSKFFTPLLPPLYEVRLFS